MGNNDTAVYIGAGINVLPIILFRNITLFIYIDKSPFTNISDKFVNDFHKTITNIGYYKVHNGINQNLFEYQHGSRITRVLYFMNNNFPTKIDNMALDYIKKASILICGAHSPHKIIFDLMKPGEKYFIGNNQDIYNSTLNSSIIKEYYRYDIPKGYTYWIPKYVETQHSTIIPIVKCNSLKDFKN